MGTTTTTSYTYDAANRLSTVNAGTLITYTWDNNGNLLYDGVSSFTYNTANRLTGASQAGLTSSYAYNGLGDRLQQTVNGATTRYTLDLVNPSGLTQVLWDHTNLFLYGNGRLVQKTATDMTYFLDDALGSVRQLTDIGGVVRMVRTYQPFGSVASSSGAATTPYGLDGEWTDNHKVLRRDSPRSTPNRPKSKSRVYVIAGNRESSECCRSGHGERGASASALYRSGYFSGDSIDSSSRSMSSSGQ